LLHSAQIRCGRGIITVIIKPRVTPPPDLRKMEGRCINR